jgi:hypothetical protein
MQSMTSELSMRDEVEDEVEDEQLERGLEEGFIVIMGDGIMVD